jgi:HEAT repeat protein
VILQAAGYTYEEIAAGRGWSQTKIKRCVYEGRAALKTATAGVRRHAAISLAQLGDSRALEPVRRAHEESRGFTRRRIGRALGDLETRFG